MTPHRLLVAVMVLLTIAAIGEYVLAWVFGIDLPPNP